ncbi:MAG: molybdate ABC transporter substrate-binding protein [Parvibaculum sp.]|nr:molybdate ABC transporter substrate-binding protein [Parvibaculum sp.]
MKSLWPVLLLAAALFAAPAAADERPLAAAASDLQFALTDVAAAFTQATGREVRLSFGSSGNFFRQIKQGAPFELFFSADEDFVFDLAKDGFTEDDGVLYALGRIALLLPHGSPLKADPSLGDLREALDDGRLKRFAIANPEHAPYGMRAEEALREAGLWEAIESRLVLGENVSQAAQFAMSGNAQGGIVAYSLALAPELAAKADHVLIPDHTHQPLRQRAVAMKGAGATAQAFLTFAQSDEARAIMRRYGFVLPGEEM